MERAPPSGGSPVPPKPLPARDPVEERRALARRALSLSDAALLAECEEAFYVGSGPGGQHRNKTESAVRLSHLPTGLTVTATERRSQSRNRSEALSRLREALLPLLARPKVRRPTRPGRAARERRLKEKRQTSRRKADRRADD